MKTKENINEQQSIRERYFVQIPYEYASLPELTKKQIALTLERYEGHIAGGFESEVGKTLVYTICHLADGGYFENKPQAQEIMDRTMFILIELVRMGLNEAKNRLMSQTI